jgi:hypothetical protein
MPELGGVGVAPKTAENGVAVACTCKSKCGTKFYPCFGARQECRPHSEDALGCHATKPDARSPAACKCCNAAGGLVAEVARWWRTRNRSRPALKPPSARPGGCELLCVQYIYIVPVCITLTTLVPLHAPPPRPAAATPLVGRRWRAAPPPRHCGRTVPPAVQPPPVAAISPATPRQLVRLRQLVRPRARR